MKSNENKYIYVNPTSGHFRLIVWIDGRQKTLGTFKDIESARAKRDELMPDGKNPFAKTSHNMTDEQIGERADERFEELKKQYGVK